MTIILISFGIFFILLSLRELGYENIKKLFNWQQFKKQFKVPKHIPNLEQCWNRSSKILDSLNRLFEYNSQANIENKLLL